MFFFFVFFLFFFAFRRPQNLSDILTHSKMNFSQNLIGSVSACKNADALIVKLLMNQIISVVSVPVKLFLHKQDFNCTSENVI